MDFTANNNSSDMGEELLPTIAETRLFPLEPRGLGTSQVESLSSYITRLADHYNKSTYLLIMEDMALNIPYYFDSYSSVNGMGKRAKEFIKRLTRATHVNQLEFTTILSLRKAISPYNLCESNKKWCPQCFNEWQEKGNTLYEPLLWVLKDVEVCHIHNIPLSTNCPTCDTVIPISYASLHIGYCFKCNNWLSLPANNQEIPQKDMEAKLYFAKNIASLFESLPGRSISPHRKNILKALKRAIKETTGGKANLFCKKYDIPEASISHWLNKEHLPSLKELLRLCFNMDITFLDLIDNNIKQALKNKHPVKLERSKRGPQDQLSNPKEIEEQLKAVLESDSEITSIETLAVELKCSTEWLYRKFNKLIKQITAKRKQQSKEKQAILLKEKQKLIRKIVKELVDNCIYPSARQVKKAANDEYILMDPKCYKTWEKCKERYLKKLNSPKKEKNNA